MERIKNLIQKCLWGAFAIFLGACSSGIAGGSVASPQWFLSAPKDGIYLYGNGSANSLEEAKKIALNDLASSIQVKINSNTAITNTQDDTKQSSSMSQNIQLSLSDLELQNIELKESAYQNNRYYAQVRVKKSILLQNLEHKYNALFGTLPAIVPQCASISLKDKNELEDLLARLGVLAQTILALKPNANLTSLTPYQKVLQANSPNPLVHLVFSPTDDEALINSLSGEYAKFFKNTSDKNTFVIKNKLTTQSVGNGIKITLEADFYDCNQKLFLHIEANETNETKEKAQNRLKVKLYKSLKEYGGGDDDIPRI
ncbi:LPP20 family lipoprotein [Helicobacter sp. 11S02596-1]|uniref:LPP20 family lipoprotein n=1 Tax=Helicobacter sp. 11S02596-1 TaxID=1476194 RepID=UPI000BA4F401|nr:LPP20 family lipoprotein [Helicobacter sp. 11S02596-1]PAF44467.1 hypothetical protein BJI48_02770 [Helicobacter sp. 11S02596-1]